MAMSTVERQRLRRGRMKLKKSPASANTLKGGGSVLPPGNEALMLRGTLSVSVVCSQPERPEEQSTERIDALACVFSDLCYPTHSVCDRFSNRILSLH
jgi:hypothetical protein